VPRQRTLTGLAIAAMVAFIVATMILAGLHLGGKSQTIANASFCATAQAQITPDANATADIAPGQGSFANQIPANCRE
jgi:hypothetical protein